MTSATVHLSSRTLRIFFVDALESGICCAITKGTLNMRKELSEDGDLCAVAKERALCD